MFGVGCLWGLRRRKRIVLVGYRKLIVVGESMGLMRADVGHLRVSGCADREMNTVVVVAATETVVLDRYMRMVVVHFEVDTVALECGSLSWSVKRRMLPGNGSHLVERR